MRRQTEEISWKKSQKKIFFKYMKERNRSANIQIIGVPERENINGDEEIIEGIMEIKFSQIK